MYNNIPSIKGKKKKNFYTCQQVVLPKKMVGVSLGHLYLTKKKMKSLFDLVKEVGKSQIGLTYSIDFYDDGKISIDIISRNLNESGRVDKYIVFSKIVNLPFE